MIKADRFLAAAKEAGITFFSGVPCSFLTPLINRVIGDDELTYVAAASEGEAVAIAAGSWLAGRRAAGICQNSGLGNAVNPLTSLNHPFRIPILMVVTWRGGPGLKDEPQHELMGEITPGMLDVMGIPHAPFPKQEAEIPAAVAEALSHMTATGLPFAFIMEKGDVAKETLDAKAPAPRPRGTAEDLTNGGTPVPRMAAMECLLSVLPENAGIIAATGKCGRELFTLNDRRQHLYQVGSMGCVAPMALGTALNTDKPIVGLDGDGAALMKMGAFATVGAYGPDNLLHVVLDNATYDSTGGQPTVSGSVDFASVAVACGYAGAAACDGLDDFEMALIKAMESGGPRLIHMKIAKGSTKDLGRPTVHPSDVARRFREFVCG